MAGSVEIGTIKSFVTAVLLGGLGLALAATVSAADVAPDASPATGVVGPYAAYSDDQLTALAAQWDALDLHARRALLTEVRARMATPNVRDTPAIRIQTERRYGRLVRKSDGRVIHIQTQVVRVRPAPHPRDDGPGDPRALAGYGVGFEERVRSREHLAPRPQPDTRPVVVSDPVIQAAVDQPLADERVKPSAAPGLQSSSP